MLCILPGTSLVPSGLHSHFTQVGKPTVPTAQRLQWLPRMLGLHAHWPVVSLHWVLYEPKVLQLHAVDRRIKTPENENKTCTSSRFKRCLAKVLSNIFYGHFPLCKM